MAGKVKNYLKSFEEVTAPLNWKSSPDAPETQLAYVTQPEIDMLVKANLHGSMDGQPNVGPQGIMSLDGGDKISDKSFGKQMGVTIDTSTKSGQDKRQKFRDRTGSNVVTDDEKKGREDLGREAADTSAKAGGMSDTEYEKKWGETKGGKSTDTGTEEEKKKTWLEKLNIMGPSIKDPLERKKLELIKAAIENWQGNMPNYSFGELLAKNLGAMTMGRYKKLIGEKDLYRDDDKGFNIGSLEAAEGKYPGSFTREGLEDFIRSIDSDANILGQLKRHNPELYYSFNDPQTSGGITELAGLDAQKYAKKYTDDGSINPNYNPEFAQQIFNARMEEDKMKGSGSGGGGFGGGGSGGGGPTAPTTPTPPTTPDPGAGNQFAVAPEGKIGFTPDELGTIDPVTGKPIGYQWGSFADYIPQTQVNLTDMSYYNPLEAYGGFNPLAGYVYNDGGIVQLGHGGYLDDYAAADSLMFKDPQDEEEWEYNV